MTTQRVTAEGSLQAAEQPASVADAELLFGHAISAGVRTNSEYFWDVMGVGEDQ